MLSRLVILFIRPVDAIGNPLSEKSPPFYPDIPSVRHHIANMGRVTTPAKGSTVSDTESDWGSGLRTRSQTKHPNNSTASSRPLLYTTPSKISSVLSDNSSIFDDEPLTPPPTEGAGPTGKNPSECEVNVKGRDSAEPIVDFQSVEVQGNSDAARRSSIMQLKENVVQFGSSNYKIRTDLHRETDDMGVGDPLPSKKATKGNPSPTLTRPPPQDADQILLADAPAIPTTIPTGTPPSRKSSPNKIAAPCPEDSLETTTSLITTPQLRVLGSPCNSSVAKSHNSPKGTPEKPKISTPPKDEVRRSPRILKINEVKANTSADTPDIETPSQNPWKEVRGKHKARALKLDKEKATKDEYRASTTLNRAPRPVARKTNDVTKASVAVHGSVNLSKKADVKTTKLAGGMEFAQYEKKKSPNDIKIDILRIILLENKNKNPSIDKQPGFIYMYELKGSKGYIKIGKSNQNHGVRVAQWAKDCKLEFEQISDPNDRKFLNYEIVEKLVHAELSNERKKYKCKECKKGGNKKSKDENADHGEWFQVTEQRALEVIEKWRGWIVQQRPYRKDGALRGVWRWKHSKLSEANTDCFKECPILTWDDWLAYSWCTFDDCLEKEFRPLFQFRVFTYIGVVLLTVVLTAVWAYYGLFLFLSLIIIAIAMFFRYR